MREEPVVGTDVNSDASAPPQRDTQRVTRSSVYGPRARISSSRVARAAVISRGTSRKNAISRSRSPKGRIPGRRHSGKAAGKEASKSHVNLFSGGTFTREDSLAISASEFPRRGRSASGRRIGDVSLSRRYDNK
jgi:phage tail tape-measure protein